MDYETLRQFADSWGLLALFLFFVGVIFFTFRPGSRKSAEDASRIPLREDPDRGDRKRSLTEDDSETDRKED